METYGKILLIAMPAFLILVLIEKGYGILRGKDTVQNLDMVSSLSSGVTNVTKDVLGLSIAIISYEWLLNHLALTQLNATWYSYLIAFIVLDFAGYLVHAIDHRVNFFWNSHIIHHSSESFNLACALRQNVSVFIRVFVVFLLPAALLGVPAEVIAVVAPLHLFAQFWYHTQHIGKMGFLEKIIVTPSHHRVHHAINPEYMDKNFGQIFIFWDKIFGTFQKELDDVPPVYGVSRPVRTWNPLKINFQHLSLMIKDAWHTQSMKDKCRLWFMPTGWRPEDVKTKFPVYKIEDIYQYKKYETNATILFSVWLWVQLVLLLLLLSYLFGNIAVIGQPGIYLYGAFVFLFVYALTDSMDGNRYFWIWDLFKSLFGLGLIIYWGDWFSISEMIHPICRSGLIGYFIGSPLISFFFYQKNKKEQLQLSAM